MVYMLLSVMPFFVDVFWIALMLVDSKKLNLPKRYLVFFLSLSAINYFAHAAFFNHQYQLYTILDSVWIFSSLAGYPLYYYYIRLLTTDETINWRWIWLIAPSILLSLYSAVIYLLMSPQETEIFVQGVLYSNSDFPPPYPSLVRLLMARQVLFQLIFGVQVLLCLYFGVKKILEYNSKIRDFYSNTGEKDLSPIKWVFMAFVFASFISLLSNFIGKTYFVGHQWLLVFPSVTHSLFLFLIGYVGYKQDFTIVHFNHDIRESETHLKVSDISLSDTSLSDVALDLKTLEAVQQKFISLLVDDQVFKNSDLRITDVCRVIGTNRSYLSKVVNENMNTNFNDLVNCHRIDFAKKLMMEMKKGDTLNEIGVAAGFSSTSSFFRSFKKVEGITPNKWRIDKRHVTSDTQ